MSPRKRVYKVGDQVIYSKQKMAAKYVNDFPGVVLKIVGGDKVIVRMTGPKGEVADKMVSVTRIRPA